MLDFTAIDFETANSYRGSPCSVGLVKVRDGQVVDTKGWLIHPPAVVDRFDPFNVHLHGITPEMVADAPSWKDILPRLVDYIDSDVVVAHNAAFDTGVIRYACEADAIEWPSLDYLCTLVLARRVLQLPSYRLPFVAEACGVELIDHHDAVADARAAALIATSLSSSAGFADLSELAAARGVRVGRMGAGVNHGCMHKSTGYSRRTYTLEASEVNPGADAEGYLYGRVIVFTGKLSTMTRQEAWDEVARAGGIPELNTTKRTNVLVIGEMDPARLRPGVSLSGKVRKAALLQDAGQDIELMTEADFLQHIGGGQVR